MAEREEDERLIKLREEGKHLYSISRLNAVNQCPYQAYLNYYLEEEEKPGIYGCAGSKVHDLIEACIKNEADVSEIKPAIISEIEDLAMMGIEFPKSKDGQDLIKDNWIKNMTRFAEEFKVPKGKFTTEELLILPIDDKNVIIGYADAIRHNTDGSVWLIDWKTSAQFDKNHLLEAGRQLIIYKLALEKLGYKVAKTSWCMLKYCETTWEMKNGKTKSKISEWRNYIKDLKSTLEKALNDAGYDDVDTEIYINSAMKENRLDPLPEEVKSKFKTSIYVRDYEITDELIAECKQYVLDSIVKFEGLEKEENRTHCDIDKQSYFCCNLCGYGGNSGKCIYWQDYCDKFTKESDDDDLF